MLTSTLVSWWGVERAGAVTERVFRWEADAPSCTHMPYIPTLHNLCIHSQTLHSAFPSAA